MIKEIRHIPRPPSVEELLCLKKPITFKQWKRVIKMHNAKSPIQEAMPSEEEMKTSYNKFLERFKKERTIIPYQSEEDLKKYLGLTKNA